MTFSYTQIAQYLRCPRSYRHRYLDGWREKDSRASLLFGRCFEKALAAFFSGENSTAALFKEWAVIKTRSSSIRVQTTGTACFAHLRITKCSHSRVANDACGNRKRNRGNAIFDVCASENESVEAKDMSTAQIKTGIHRFSWFIKVVLLQFIIWRLASDACC